MNPSILWFVGIANYAVLCGNVVLLIWLYLHRQKQRCWHGTDLIGSILFLAILTTSPLACTSLECDSYYPLDARYIAYSIFLFFGTVHKVVSLRIVSNTE